MNKALLVLDLDETLIYPGEKPLARAPEVTFCCYSEANLVVYETVLAGPAA